MGGKDADTPLNSIYVGYDLNAPGKDYAKLIDKIKSYPPKPRGDGAMFGKLGRTLAGST